MGLVPDREVIEQVEAAGGKGKPRFGQVHVCWADDEPAARSTALEWWPNAVAGGNLNWELPLPSLFEDATEWAGEDEVAESVVCGPDPDRHTAAVRDGGAGGASATQISSSRARGRSLDGNRDRRRAVRLSSDGL